MLLTYTQTSLIIMLLIAAGNANAGGNAERGQLLYQNRCSACHSLEYNGVGPAHKKVYGRKAGSAPNYAYSEALQRSLFVLDKKTLDKWLTNPERFIAGQKMGFSVTNARERADLIAYLKKASAE